jgi:hypothetical protein
MFSDSDIPAPASSGSYVYPVRSLLSNSIQRASNATSPVSHETIDMLRRQSGAVSETRANGWATDGLRADPDPKLPSPRRRRTVSDSSATPPTPRAASPSKKSRKRRHRASIASPNFRHFPGEDSGPNFTATTLIKSDLPLDTLAVFSPSTSVANVVFPRATPEPKPSPEPPQELRARPKQFPVSDDPLPPEEVPDVPWNPSQFDFVHLPPFPSTSIHSRDQSRNSSTNQSGLSSPRATSASDGAQRSESSQSSNGISGSDSECSDASDVSQFLTVRFEHVQDEHGNHVIVGREGKLARCEDEVRLVIDAFLKTNLL